jgi:hypothetical protein
LLIEAMIAILIFSLGILGMIAMGGTAIGAQSDARYRTDAQRLVDEIAGGIAIDVDRTSPVNLQASLLNYAHQTAGGNCTFSGGASANAVVTNWVSRATTVGSGLPGLPGATAANQQILVSSAPTGPNRIEITVCWRDPGTPAGAAMRRHTLVTYVN